MIEPVSMRILHIISTLDPASGGPAESVRLLMSYTDVGYQGEVVCFDDPGEQFLKDLPFKVHALGKGRLTYGLNTRLYTWLRSNRDRFDGFIVNGLWQFCGIATMVALRGSNKPYMVFTHGMLDPYFKRKYPLKHIKKIIYWYPFEYWVLRNAYHVLFTTETERDLAEQSFALHRWKPYVVPYGVKGPLPSRRQGDIDTFFEFHPNLRNKRFLIFLGRIHRKKGCDLLVRAFAELASTMPAVDLVMAGPDQQGWVATLRTIAAKAGIADRIHWTGTLRGAAKWGALHACEAFILPSHQENFGIAVAESLACGKPVLLSDQVNIISVLQHDGCSIIEPDTLAGTRRLIERWNGTPETERTQMRERAVASFEARFDMRQNALVILQLFQQARHDPRYQQPSTPEAA